MRMKRAVVGVGAGETRMTTAVARLGEALRALWRPPRTLRDPMLAAELFGTTTTTTEPEVEKPTVVRVVVVNGAPEGGIVRRSVDKGDRVVIVVKSDVADEVHLHGYDISRDVAAGGTVRIAFPATIPGRFEIELEERGVQIADLTVGP